MSFKTNQRYGSAVSTKSFDRQSVMEALAKEAMHAAYKVKPQKEGLNDNKLGDLHHKSFNAGLTEQKCCTYLSRTVRSKGLENSD